LNLGRAGSLHKVACCGGLLHREEDWGEGCRSRLGGIVVKAAESPSSADKLCALRTFHPARGGEASGVPGAVSQSFSRTRLSVRRATPFVALAAIFAIQALADAQPVVAFPLYLTVVLLVSLQQNRVESIAVAFVAAVAVLVIPLASAGQASDVAPAVLLAAVLVGVAVAMSELARHAREAAAET